MFSGLTNYFFGGNTENSEASQLHSQESPQESVESRLQPPTCDSNSQEPDSCHLKTSPVDDEWIIVDKTRGNSLQRMEDNPMENLLIEHPSMSVYGPRGRQNSTGVDSLHSESSEDVDMAVESQESSKGRRNMMSLRHPPRRPRAVAARAGLVSNRSDKCVKAAEHRYNTRNLAKTNLERRNRVHQVNGRGKTAHRRDHRITQPAVRLSYKRC